MKINLIRILNLNSIHKAEFDLINGALAESGIFAITGEMGSGKSTILDAITLALFGRTPRGQGTEIMTHGTAECFAEVEYQAKGTFYRSNWNLKRARNNPNGKIQKPKMHLQAFDPSTGLGIGDSFQGLKGNASVPFQNEQILRLDFDRFCRSVLLAQGGFAAFLTAKNDEKSRLLESITGTQIYSDLSRAAFLKNKEIKRKVEDLELELKAFQIPPKEKILTQEKEIINLNKYVNDISHKTALLQSQIDIQKQLAIIETNLQKLRSEQLTINQQAPDILKYQNELKNHELAFPIFEKQTLAEKINKEIQSQQKEIKDAKQLLFFHQEKLNKNKENLQSIHQEKENFSRYYKEQSNKINKAHELDIQLSNAKDNLSQANDTLKVSETQLSNNVNLLKLEFKKYKTLKDNFEDNNLFLKENTILTDAQIDIIKLNNQRESLKRIYKEKKNTQSETNEVLRKKTSLSTDLKTTKSQIAQWRASSKQIIIELQNQLDDKSIVSMPDLETKIKELEESKPNIIEKSGLLGIQLQKLSNIRNLLLNIKSKPNNQSIESNHFIFTNIDRLKTLVAQSHNLNKTPIFETINSLEINLFEIVNSTKNLPKDFNSKLQLMYQEQYDQIISNWPNLKELLTDDFEPVKIILSLKQQYQNDQNNANVMHSSLQALRDLQTKINAKIDHIKNVKEKNSELQNTSSKLKDSLNKITTNYNEQLYIYNSILSKYGYQSQIGLDSNSFIVELQSLSQKYQKANEAQTKFSTREVAIKSNISNLEKNNKSLQNNLNRNLKNKQLAQQKYQSLKTDRSKILFNSAKKAAIQLENKKNQIENQISSLIETKISMDKEISLLMNRIELITTNLVKQKKSLKELNLKISTSLSNSSFDPNTILKTFVIDEQSIQNLKNQIENYNKNKHTIEQNLISTQNDIKLLSIQSKDFPPILNNQQKLLELKEKEAETNKKIGSISTTLNRIKIKIKENQIRTLELDAIQNDLKKWSIIDKLIGSSDGKKFRSYAQSITLRKLILIANKHLKHLHGRYQIVYSPQKDKTNLDFQIKDIWQADTIRSTSTLSGGESFLVSLALALALSDFAGKNINIQTLFIDEGFASVDSDTLDIALNTLEKLKKERDKTIGIISHLPNIKERITTQINLKKSSSGISTHSINS